MADSHYVNVFITSKNRSATEKPCDFLLSFPSGLIKANSNQGIRITVLSFHIPNNFYNINHLNDRFDIIIRDGESQTVIPFDIAHGNYSIITFRDYINNIASQYLNLVYNSSRNTYSIKSNYADATKKVYLKPITSSQFFGLNELVEYELQPQHTECVFTANMCSFDKIVINAYGLNPELMSIENIGKNDPDFERSSILLWVSRTDIPINGMIKYDNICNSFSYNIHDTSLNAFRLILTDEYGNLLDTALDYTMLLRFEIYEKNTRELYLEISRISEYLKFIYIQMMLLLEFIGLLKK
jgi:hypothetical protein